MDLICPGLPLNLRPLPRDRFHDKGDPVQRGVAKFEIKDVTSSTGDISVDSSSITLLL